MYPRFKANNQHMRASLALNQRKILLYDDVDETSILECIYFLNRLNYIDNKFHKDKKDPIEIQINTNGGFVEDGLSLISLIEQMKDDGYEIITTNIGKAYSMGFLISLCGSIRKAYRHSIYMYHDISYGAYGKHGDVIDSMEHAEYLRDIINNIVTSYTSFTVDDIQDINVLRKDKFFTPSDMLEIKGVDIIV